MSRERGGYGFSSEDKKMVREMSDGQCALSGDPHNGVVHHITGCYIARLDGIPRGVVSDPYQNAIMLSEEMAQEHDREEDYQRACLEYEKYGRTIYEGNTYLHPDLVNRRALRNARHQRRRKKA